MTNCKNCNKEINIRSNKGKIRKFCSYECSYKFFYDKYKKEERYKKKYASTPM